MFGIKQETKDAIEQIYEDIRSEEEWNAWNRKNLESLSVKIVAENWHKVVHHVYDVENAPG